MASPKGCQVEIAGLGFSAFAVNLHLEHYSDEPFLVEIGRPVPQYEVWANMHDTVNLPYGHLSRFMEMCMNHTQDNRAEMNLMLLGDEDEEVLLTVSFVGCVTAISFGSTPPPYTRNAGGAPDDFNHIMYLKLFPIIDEDHGIKIDVGN